jgi:hypothetical protein
MSTTFNESFYLSENLDVVLAISQGTFTSALQHFTLFGGKELRNPNSTFDSSYYSVQNPDVLSAVSSGVFSSAFAHFTAFGVAEDRAPTIAFANFDASAYLTANADISAAVTAGTISSALEHYMAFGAAEGREGSGISESIVNPGTTFTLTTSNNQVTGGVDNFTGTDNNDTFVALADGALDQSDIIDGGAGTDTLKARYNLTANNSLTSSVVNVENLTIDVDDGDATAAHTLTFNVSGFTGLSSVAVTDFDSVNATKDTANVTNIASGVAVGVTNGDADGLYDFDYASTSGGSDAATLNLTAAKADNVTIAGIETLTVNAVSGSSTLDILTAAAATSLVVTGSGNVTVTSLASATATALAAVDASAATGNVSIGDLIAGTVTLTGGTGDDTFSVGANLTALDTITGGAGTDTIKVDSTSETAALSLVTGIEAYEIEDDTVTTNVTTTVSGTVSSGIVNFIVDANDSAMGDSNAYTIALTNIDSGDTITINDSNSDVGDADGVSLSGVLTTDSAADIVNLTFSGIGAVGAAAATGIDTITLNSHETINIASNANSGGTVTANGVEALSTTGATGMVITGSASLTVSAVANTTSLTSIDASAMTGKLTLVGVDASALSFTAAAADTSLTMTGLNASDTIVGGAGTKDVLINTATTGLSATSGILNVTNVETVELRATAANTIDGSKLSGVNEVSVSGATPGTQTFTNIAAGLAIGIGDSAAVFDNGATVNVSLADETGSSDSITFNVDNTSSANTDASLTTTGIETVNIAVSANGNNAQVLLANSASSSVVVTGGAAATVLTHNGSNKALTSFDSTGFSGDVVLTAAASTAAVSLTTGGAQTVAHSITGSGNADTITIGKTAAVAVTAAGGAGTDELNLTATTGFVSTANISAFETINLTIDPGTDVTLTNVAGVNDAALDNLNILGGNSLSTFANSTALGAATTVTINAGTFTGNVDLLLVEAAIDAGATVTVSGGALTTDKLSFLATNSTTLALNTSGIEEVNIKEATGASSISFTNSDASLVTLDTDNNITLTGLGASTNLQFGLTAAGATKLTAVDGVEAVTVVATYSSVSATDDAVTVNLADTDAGTATATLDIDGIEALTFDVKAKGGGAIENHNISLAGTANATNKIAVTVTGGATANNVTFAASGAVTDVTSIDASAHLGALILNSAARLNSGAMTITGALQADTIAFEHAGDVLTGGGGSDTLSIQKSAILGGMNIDLTSTTDQVTTFNGSATTGTVLGFENVDASGYTSASFGAEITGTTGVNTVTGTANADVIPAGGGNDVVTGGNGADIVTLGAGDDDFTVGIGLGDLDQITDFAAGDDLAIDVANTALNTYFEGAIGLVANTDEFTVITGAVLADGAAAYAGGIFVASTQSIVVFLDNNTTTAKLYYDADGETGGADGEEIIEFTNITSLAELAAAFSGIGDFILS